MNPLWVYAAPREGEPWVGDPRMLALGVGKVAATITLLRHVHHKRPDAVVLFGVAGAHPCGPSVGELGLVTADWLADEGVEVPGGFLSLESLGLGRRGPFDADPAGTDWLDHGLGSGLWRGIGATVSTCSGTDARAQMVRRACPPVGLESMEGAAVGAVCTALGIPWAQLRVVSNRVGDRDRGGWDLDRALDRLHRAVRRVLCG